jgi:hypothetical protein
VAQRPGSSAARLVTWLPCSRGRLGRNLPVSECVRRAPSELEAVDVSPVGRRVREAVNPYSTAFTRWWCHSAWRRHLRRMTARSGPAVRPTSGRGAGGANDRLRLRRETWQQASRPVEAARVPSPAGWAVPPGVRPAWNWTPPSGLAPRLDRAPRWVRWWYRTPLLDRYAHAWMWWHGAWDVEAPAAPPRGDETGVREPRHPTVPSGQFFASGRRGTPA